MSNRNVPNAKISRSRAAVVLFLAAMTAAMTALLAACGGGGPAEEEPLETVDVAPALELDTAEDQKAPERKVELVGRLPADFPKDLPLFLPASLVDFGDAPGGVSVTLLTGRPLPEVRRQLLEKVRAAGWEVAPGQEGSYELRRGGRKARLEIVNGNPGTSTDIHVSGRRAHPGGCFTSSRPTTE